MSLIVKKKILFYCYNYLNKLEVLKRKHIYYYYYINKFYFLKLFFKNFYKFKFLPLAYLIFRCLSLKKLKKNYQLKKKIKLGYLKIFFSFFFYKYNYNKYLSYNNKNLKKIILKNKLIKNNIIILNFLNFRQNNNKYICLNKNKMKLLRVKKYKKFMYKFREIQYLKYSLDFMIKKISSLISYLKYLFKFNLFYYFKYKILFIYKHIYAKYKKRIKSDEKFTFKLISFFGTKGMMFAGFYRKFNIFGRFFRYTKYFVPRALYKLSIIYLKKKTLKFYRIKLKKILKSFQNIDILLLKKIVLIKKLNFRRFALTKGIFQLIQLLSMSRLKFTKINRHILKFRLSTKLRVFNLQIWTKVINQLLYQRRLIGLYKFKSFINFSEPFVIFNLKARWSFYSRYKKVYRELSSFRKKYLNFYYLFNYVICDKLLSQKYMLFSNFFNYFTSYLKFNLFIKHYFVSLEKYLRGKWFLSLLNSEKLIKNDSFRVQKIHNLKFKTLYKLLLLDKTQNFSRIPHFIFMWKKYITKKKFNLYQTKQLIINLFLPRLNKFSYYTLSKYLNNNKLTLYNLFFIKFYYNLNKSEVLKRKHIFFKNRFYNLQSLNWDANKYKVLKIFKYIKIFVKVAINNIFVTAIDPYNGNVLKKGSCGLYGAKGARKFDGSIVKRLGFDMSNFLSNIKKVKNLMIYILSNKQSKYIKMFIRSLQRYCKIFLIVKLLPIAHNGMRLKKLRRK